MDLSALNSSLPQGLADAERDMGEKFRAAALSITTLYKSSLACNKQAYQVGYSAALSDVLSKLQSDIAAGEDAAVALARLMDWTEARQTAMAAFAADDDEAPPAAAAATRPMTLAPQQRHLVPPRPSSAPVDARPRGFGKEKENKDKERETLLTLRSDAMDADHRPATVMDTTHAHPPHDDRLPPPSSSPIASPLVSRPLAPPPLRLQRSGSSRAAAAQVQVPTSSFNFSIPSLAVAVDTHAPQVIGGPVQTGPIGAKRGIVDAEMSDPNSVNVNALAIPTTPSRGPRAAKRRSMGMGILEPSEEKSVGGGGGGAPGAGGAGGGGRRGPRRGGPLA